MLRLFVALGVFMGCEEVLVEPIPVRMVRVVPDTAELFEGESVQLLADLRDESDEPLRGRTVTWTTNDSDVATVDPDGLVLAAGPGSAAITATAEGQTGMARVVILRRPFIDVARPAISLVYTQGDPAVAPVPVAITNGGDGALTGLAASIDYEVGIGGWLDIELADTEAPTTLNLTVFAPSLELGEYAAAVWIADLGASNSPVRLDVALRVRENVPDRPTALRVAGISTDGVQLAWTDNSDNEDEFRVERASATDTFQMLSVVPAGMGTHTDSTAAVDSEYRYRVSACNTGGCSPPSDTATATTAPAPATDLAVTTRSAHELRLDWTDGSRTETEFRIQRRTGDESFRYVATVGTDVTSHQDTALEAATRYEYRVTACNPSGCADPTAVALGITADVPPVAPIDVSASTVSTSRVAVSWTDASDNETAFRIERSVDGGAFTAIDSVGAGVTAFSDTGVSADTRYDYRVLACNGEGCSTPSATAATVTPPNVPTGVAATVVSDTRIDLTWTDNSATETSFRIERQAGTAAFVQVAETAADVTGFSSTGLTPATTYGFRVRACNSGGCSGYSTIATATTLTTPPPADPTGLTATLSASGTGADLSWTDNATTETGFRVHRSTDGGAFVVLATVAADTTRYTDTGLAADRVYAYRVDACSDAGCSGFTNEAVIETAPLAPSATATAVVGADQIDVRWTDNSATEDEFRVERSVAGGAFTALTTVGAGVTGFSDTGVTADTEYAYRVTACNTAGCSPFSASASATTPPTPPTAPTATYDPAGRIDLGWTDNSATETSFRIQRSANGDAFIDLATVGADVTAYADGTVADDTQYAYRVAACNAGGCSPYSGTATTATPPTAPSGLAASALSDTEIGLSWTDNSATETEFRIQRRTGTAAFAQVGTVDASVTAFTDAGLDPATTYDYRVLACSAAGCSAPSAVASATTGTVPAPFGLTATVVSAARVDLAWSDTATTETGFQIERSASGGGFVVLGTVAADTTSFTDATTAADTDYTYRVAACDGAVCTAYSNLVTVATPPATPTGLTASANSDTEVGLTWTDNSATETEFRVERSTDGGATFAQVGTVGAGVTTFDDTGLQPATTYDYRVLACNAAGCSTPSAVASATTAPIPAPSGLIANVVSSSQIDLAWTDNSGTETEFRIERSTDGGVTFAALATTGINVTSYSDGAVQGDTEYTYRVTACNATSCSAFSNLATVATPPVAPSNAVAITVSDTEVDVTWTDNSATETEFRIERRIRGGFSIVGTVGTDVTAFRDSGLMPATDYDYRISACNASGCSSTTSPASVTTDSIPAPTGFTATAIAAGQIDLAWQDNSQAETELRIERSVDGGAFAALASIAGDLTAYSDLTTTEGTTYAYRIQACDAATCSSFSTQATATTPPVAASGLGAAAASDTQIDLSWTDNSGVETEYRIERSTDGGSTFGALATVGANVTAYSDTGLDPSTTYDYRVLACSAAGCAGPSNTATATTDPILAPTNLSATAVSSTRIDLTWNDNSTTETTFEIERAPGGGTFVQIATVGADITDYSDINGLTAGTPYDYRVRACDTGSCSAYTAIASTTTLP